MAIEERLVPESLFQQCQYFVLMHLDEFPVSYLSLLPLNTRKELLWQLPLADVCQLEGTKFTDGLDMAACWKFPFDEHMFYGEWWGMEAGDKLCYIDEWGAVEYKRAMLYGLLTACALGFTEVRYFNFYYSPFDKVDALTFLYAVRKSTASSGQGDHIMFPSRYSHFANPGCESTVDEVVKCFGRNEGELPKIFAGIVYRDIDVGLDNVHFLYNVVCVSFLGFLFEDYGLEFIKALIKGATNLETLVFNQWGEDNEDFGLDDFCDFLPSQTLFLSKFRQLRIHSSNSCRFLGFRVSRESFNRLISAYFAAPTDHMQRFEFSCTMITHGNSSDDCSPIVEQHYLQFKAINLSGCEFATIDDDGECQFKDNATPSAISNWLGQSISKQETGRHWDCLFKVDKVTNANPRKRTASDARL